MENSEKPLKLALHGMDSRSTKTMMLFLQGPCKGIAHVVLNPEDADIDVFDGDAPDSKILLEKYIHDGNPKPAIILSLWDVQQEGILYLRKPVRTDDMVRTLSVAKKSLAKTKKTTTQIDLPAVIQKISEKIEHPIDEPEKQELKTYAAGEQKPFDKAKHQIKNGADDKITDGYIGDIEDIDVNDPKQFINAHYDPRDFFQGTVQAAYSNSKEANQVLLLKSDWKPVTLFPRTKELWIDAGDQELKEFAGIRLKRKTMAADIQLVPIDPGIFSGGGSLYKFHDMEAFLWKLACWTSKGRYPKDIDIRKPVYLRNWPNFTRLLNTPHALRIAALLIKGPRTMADIAETLHIKPQYVFVFISAAYAVGLSGQARRASDMLVQALGLQPNRSKSLMSRIIRRLRVN